MLSVYENNFTRLLQCACDGQPPLNTEQGFLAKSFDINLSFFS